MATLLQLQSYVLVPIVSDWIEMDGLANFDSSLCEKSSRPLFLQFLVSPHFIHNTDEDYSSINYFRWLAKRGIRIKKFVLTKFGNVKLSIDLQSILENINQIRYLEIELCPLLHLIVDRYCCKIDHVKLVGVKDGYSSDFNKVLSKITGLQSLALPDDFKFMLQPTQSLQNLQTVDCHDVRKTNLCELCPNLTAMNIAEVDDGTLELIMENNSKLTKFEANNCKITDDALIEIAKMYTDLCIVKLDSELLTDVSVAKLVQSCSNLTEIDVGFSLITDLTLVQIGIHCKDLQAFCCNECYNVTDVGMKSLVVGCGPTLKQLDVANCDKLTNTTIYNIANYCPQLEQLDIAGCTEINDLFFPDLLSKCKKLCHLDIVKTNVSIEMGLRLAYDCRYIYLSNDEENESSFSFSQNTKITGFEFDLCSFNMSINTCKSFTYLPVLAPNMFVLFVKSYSELTDDIVVSMLSQCPLLTELMVIDCPLITAKIVSKCTESCPNIVKMEFNKITDLTDDILIAFINTHTALKVLRVSDCVVLTDLSIIEISVKCQQLRRLELDGLCLITDHSVKEVAQHCAHISALNLRNCVLLTDKTLSNILLYTNSLRKLVVSGCRAMTRKAVTDFALQIVDLENFEY